MATAPYPTVQSALNLARARLLDDYITPVGAPTGQIGGEVLSDLAIFAQSTVNGAWQKMQEYLLSKNYSRLVETVVLPSLSAVATTDPGIFCTIDCSGYFDGTTVQTSPVLPQNFVSPLRVRERVNGTSNPFTEMQYVVDGLDTTVKRARNYNWTWDDDAIKFPGSTSVMDLEVRFESYLGDFVDTTGPTLAWYNQPIPIMRANDALAWYICAEVANARGDVDGSAFVTNGEAAADKLVEKETEAANLRMEWVIPDIPAATGATPYDYVSTIVNAAKVRLNSVNKIAADVLSPNNPYVQQYVNTAWRKLQSCLLASGYSRLVDTVTLSSIGAVATSDPGVGCTLDWTGYFNGSTLNAGIQLPAGFLSPLRLRERVHSGSPANFTEMQYVVNGLDSVAKQARNYNWTWDDDQIKIPGSTSIMDLEIRYQLRLPDFVASGSVPWYLAQAPITNCLDALALFICVEVATSRPEVGLVASDFQAMAETAAQQVVNRENNIAGLRSEWIIPDIPAATGATPYDVVSTVLNAARVRLNSVNKLAADMLSANNPYVQQYTNTAWRRFQAYLANLGFSTFNPEVIIEGLTPTVVTDPAIQVYIDWTGYFNGSTVNTAVKLPQDLRRPTWVMERSTTNPTQGLFVLMEQMLEGIQAIPFQPFNKQWQWRDDKLYMPGANNIIDLRMRYERRLPDLVAAGGAPWFQAMIPISDCLDALSLYICVEVASSRPELGLDTIAYQSQAQAAADIIYNRDVRSKQRVNARRKSRSGRLEARGGGYGFGS